MPIGDCCTLQIRSDMYCSSFCVFVQFNPFTCKQRNKQTKQMFTFTWISEDQFLRT